MKYKYLINEPDSTVSQILVMPLPVIDLLLFNKRMTERYACVHYSSMQYVTVFFNAWLFTAGVSLEAFTSLFITF